MRKAKKQTENLRNDSEAKKGHKACVIQKI